MAQYNLVYDSFEYSYCQGSLLSVFSLHDTDCLYESSAFM